MSSKGFKMLDESRLKMSLAKLKNPVRYWAGKKRPELSEKLKGRVFTDSHKEKLRQAKLNNPVRYWLGVDRKGKVHSEEYKKELAEKMKGENCPFYGKSSAGSLNPRWIVDRSLVATNEKKHLDSNYKVWMKAVKNRDGWKCKISNGSCSGRLEAHHILRWSEYPELRYQINNGITLCAFHHPKRKTDEARLSPYFRELIGKVH